MARRNASLKPHLNQIRTWVAEGVTDIWIAHQLGSTPASIASFRRQHGLTRGGADEAPALQSAVAAAGMATAAPLGEGEEEMAEAPAIGTPAADGEAPAKRRRRGRRGGRGRGRGTRRPLVARVGRDGDDLVVRIDAAALAALGADEAWAETEAAAVAIGTEGLTLQPTAMPADDQGPVEDDAS